jgi:defect-in-organelle-trafficking protein DotA
MQQIFQQALGVISQPGVNPITALANMGNSYINFAGNLWMYLLMIAITSALIPVIGVFVFALITMAMPLVFAWVGIMVGIGFITAYYVPILPYIIFVFGGLAWIIAVIEAMVAGPIVALGITHPEGHDAFGKGEPSIMLLLNVFLRPTMMIIGYISAIALTFVGVWLLNAGFDQAIAFVTNSASNPKNVINLTQNVFFQTISQANLGGKVPGPGTFSDWSAVYSFFFSVLIYTTTYLTIVQKSFTLITYLPDKILRWIGGTPETIGQESAGWGEDVKGKVQEGGKATSDAEGQVGKSLSGAAQKAVSKAVEKVTDAGEAAAKGLMK